MLPKAFRSFHYDHFFFVEGILIFLYRINIILMEKAKYTLACRGFAWRPKMLFYCVVGSDAAFYSCWCGAC
jgi:hypothetical protein